jgi:hypothetical protein
MAHKAAVKSRAGEVEREAIQREKEDINHISVQMLALTLTDDGPDVNAQHCNMQTSRSKSDSTSDEHLPDVCASPSMDAVIDSFGRLMSLYDPIANSTVESSTGPSLDTSSIDDTSPSRTSALKTVRGHMGDKSKKQQASRCTTKALDVIAAVEAQVPMLRDKLNAGTLAAFPANGIVLDEAAQMEARAALRDVESMLIKLRSGLEKVNRRLPSVDQRKAAICTQLDAIEGRITELKVVIPGLKEQPLHFSTGNILFYHTSNLLIT